MRIIKLASLLIPLLLSSCGVNHNSSQEPSSKPVDTSSVEPTTSNTSSSATSSQSSSSSSSRSSSSSSASSSSSSSSSSSVPSSSSSSSSSEPTPEPVIKEKITIEKVPNIKDDFIRGMDSSSVISLENSGVKYYDFDGYEKDLFTILANNGVTHIRIRIWNNPYNSNNKGYGGGNNDVETAIKIGKRVKAAGMKCIVDFHYSDFWSDPAKYKAPKAWSGYTITQKETALYDFTKETLESFKTNNIDVGMVQIGNEINSGMGGESYSFNKPVSESSGYFALLNKASAAVRYVYPKSTSGVKVAVHYTDPQKKRFSSYAANLNSANVDYDVFGASYYPHYHGTLDNLVSELNKVVDSYGKEAMVLETSYPFTTEETDGQGNSYGKTSDTPVSGYQFTIQGQANSYRDICNAVVNSVHSNKGIGVCYWEGTWISVGSKNWSTNYPKWNTYGSGWISQYAAGYDPDLQPGGDGKYYSQGCVIDNQAFFDMYGKPIVSLEVFKYLKDGYYPDGEPQTPHSLTINLSLQTVPSGKVNIVYSVNGSDPYLNDLEWHEMNGSDGSYSYSISDLNKDDLIYFRFASWDVTAGNLYICADDTWQGASYVMTNAEATLNCSASAFPSSSSSTTTFVVAQIC